MFGRRERRKGGPLATAFGTDEKLYERFTARSDRAALEELVRRHRDTAYQVAHVICRDAAVADEALQDAFLHLCARTRFRDRGPGSFKSWFLTVVSNAARTARRTERRSSRKKEKARCPGWQIGPTVAKPRLEGELHAVMQSALAALSERWRNAVLLYLSGFVRQKEVAVAMGVSQQLVSRNFQSALRSLRTHLTDAGYARSQSSPTE